MVIHNCATSWRSLTRCCQLDRFLTVVLLLSWLTSSMASWQTESELFPSQSKRQTASPVEDPPGSQIADSLYRMTTFYFAGTTGQFAEFPMWKPRTQPSSNMALSFQFRTKLENAFIMYMDDTKDSFLAITLYRRSLRLRFKFGQARNVMLTMGNNMNDNRWHTVLVEKTFPSIRLTVDGNVTSRQVDDVNAAQDLIPKTPTFFGALPKGYKIGKMSLPTMFFVPRFSGWMRYIMINGDYVSATRKFDVLEQTLDDACDDFRNPCQNGGVCYKTVNETSCDCSGTSFNGKYCDQSFNQAVATFTGSEWFKYEVKSISTFEDRISLFFKTSQPNGLMFHTGKSADFVSINLVGGIVQVTVNLGGGAFNINVEKPSHFFNDNKWHWVKVNRSLHKAWVKVDDIEIQNGLNQENYRELTLDNAIYVGGTPDTANLPGTQKGKTNFVGCLKEVTYVYDGKPPLTISRWAEEGNEAVSVHGNVDFSCTRTNLSLPVSFTRPDSYITIPSWSSKTKGSIEFNFRTRESNGLLMYGQGRASDLFAIEMYKGKVDLIIDLGSQTSRVPCPTSNRLYDGKWHQVKVTRLKRQVVFNVDGAKTTHTIGGMKTKLDLSSSMSVGGADYGTGFRPLRGLWTSPNRQGFVGCVQNVVIDKDIVDLRSLAQSSGRNMGPSSLGSGEITSFCGGLGGRQCNSNPCRNGASCTEGMNRFICDCSRTSYRGTTCAEAVMSASFNASQFMAFRMDQSVQTEGEDISLRFRTPLSSGLLFATASSRTKDRMSIEVENGRLKLTVDLDCTVPNCTAPRSGPDTMRSGFGLNDRKWHSVKLSRRGNRITFGVDGMHKGKPLAGQYTKLQFDSIYVGGMGDSNTTTPFAGTIQNVVFNSNYLIDSCFREDIQCDQNVSWDEGFVVAKPVTFKGSDSYVAVNTLNAYQPMSIFMSIRTTVIEGLILYNGGSSGDFVALEISEGKVMYIYNTGSGAQLLTVGNLVNDNRWHDIRIVQTGNIHNLTVDQQSVAQDISVNLNSGNKNLDLSGKLYVGGVPSSFYRRDDLLVSVASRIGFQGCMGSFEINGVLQDMTVTSGKKVVGDVGVGCLQPSPSCSPSPCSNGGICIQQWDGYICDCSLTSYVGRKCQQHDHSYRFGVDTGLILYNWRDDYPSTRTDKLGLGFATSQRNCVILRVSGYTNPPEQDFLQLSIEGGKLTLRYNVGGGRTVELRENTPVSDGSYHTVQIKRMWLNATMRVDHWPEKSVAPSGKARTRLALISPTIAPAARNTVASWLRGKERVASVFNSQSTIQIGGLLSDSAMSILEQPNCARTLTKPFRGQMMGLFFNDVRVFELAAKGDERVQFFCDVTRIGGPDISPTTPTISQPVTTMATLTVFSTTKSTPIPNGSDPDDCDDEDMCPTSSGSGAGLFVETNVPAELSEAQIITTTLTTATSSSLAHAQSGGDEGSLSGVERLLFDLGFFTTQKPVTTTTNKPPIATTEPTNDVSNDDVDDKEALYVEEEAEVAYDKTVAVPEERNRDVEMEGLDEIKRIFTEPVEDQEARDPDHGEPPTFDAGFFDVLDIFTREEVDNDPFPSPEEPPSSSTSTTTSTTSTARKPLRTIENVATKPKPKPKTTITRVTTEATKPTTIPEPPLSTTTTLNKQSPTAKATVFATPGALDAATSSILSSSTISGTAAPSSTFSGQSLIKTLKTTKSQALVHPRVIAPAVNAQSTTHDNAPIPHTTHRTNSTSLPDTNTINELVASTHGSNPHVLLFSPSTTTPGEYTDLFPNPNPTTVAADWTGSAASALAIAQTGLYRFKATQGATTSPPPPFPPMSPTRSAFPSPPAFSANNTVSLSRPPTAPVSSAIVTDPDVTVASSGGDGKVKSTTRKNPVDAPGANMINTSNTSSSPVDVTGKVMSNSTGPIYIGQATAVTTAMIAGIAAAAACCVLLLFYVMYRFKKRDSVTYNVGERERQYGVMPKKGKPVTAVKNGSMKRDAKAQKHDKEKEYYV